MLHVSACFIPKTIVCILMKFDTVVSTLKVVGFMSFWFISVTYNYRKLT